jgi:hypothetical protein
MRQGKEKEEEERLRAQVVNMLMGTRNKDMDVEGEEGGEETEGGNTRWLL